MTPQQSQKHDGIGRNDPCRCGSGKKFKKCCGADSAAEKMVEEQNKVLREVLQEFFENHPRPAEQRELLTWKNNVEDLLVPLYGEDKSNGIIGDIFFFSKRIDIWNSFIERKIQHEERPKINQVLTAWQNPVFLSGEILSITDYRAQIRDLLSTEIKEIDVNESFPVETGHIAFGFYLPDKRVSEHFMMILNSVTTAVDVKQESIQKLRDMYDMSEAKSVQEFYKQNIISVYQIFSSGLQGSHQVSIEVLELVHTLEQFLIEHDLKSDELIEAFYHYIETLSSVTKEAIGGAVQFGINQKLLKFEWSRDKLAQYFGVKVDKLQQFAEELRCFYIKAMANQDEEQEATYAFEVGTNPKANELQNWQLYMHLKNATITSETELKRKMEYFHGQAYVPKTKSEEAQLLAYDAYTAETNKLKWKRMNRVHHLDPVNTDGLLLAAEAEMDRTVKEHLLKQAVTSGMKNFEPEMEVAWLYVPNRPYLRALFLLGNFYWQQASFKEAFEKFYELLRLNPGDHQGVRYLAISSLIALGQLERAESLISHYEDEHTDNAFYSWFKWSIQRKKDLLSKATQELFLDAIEKNPYVKKSVVHRKDALPYPKTAVITPRSPEEARLIWTFLAPTL